MCDYEEVIKQDVELALRENYGYGDKSIEQFWLLNGEQICEDAYESITDILYEAENKYSSIVGDIEL